MSLDVNSGEFITLGDAQAFVLAYRRLNPTKPKGFFAGSDKLSQILGQSDCIGVRIYSGFNDIEKKINMVIVGVNFDERDMTEGLMMERLTPCPSVCDVNSALYNI